MKYDSEEDKKQHLAWIKQLGELQQADLDQRQQAREADRAILDKEGQWDEAIAERIDSEHRPRYTFDQMTPAIEFIMGDIEDMDFGSNVKPADGEASKETADTYEGMIRGIESMSNASKVYRDACRRLVRRGFDAWIVKAEYANEWSFEQDLTIKPIKNAINRVWLANSEEEDGSDSDAGYVMTSVSPEKYKEQFPDGKAISVSDSDLGEQWDEYVKEVVTFGERYYKKETTKEIAQLSNGEVVELNDDFEKVKDEYEAKGITVKRTKKIKDYKIYHRFFDGGGMLSKETETVHKSMNIVTVYGNYEVLGESSKAMWHGIVMKLMDYQQVLNYAKSREVEEGALSPREKTWMTAAQAEGHEQELQAMNVSAAPVQLYNADTEAPPPFKTPPSQINPHLATLSENMSSGIQISAGVNNAMNGAFAGRMSEEALRMQIDRGTGATRKWVNALVNGISRTCNLLVQAIPETYDTKRIFSIVGEDGSEDMVTLNEEVFDQQSQQMININQLNKGKYKVICDAGEAFSNQLEAGLKAMLDYAAIDPSIVQTGGDLILSSIDAPLVDKMAERKRVQLLQAGGIPESQMTDEEKQQMQAQAQQPKEPDANTLMAMAEMKKGEADIVDAKTKAKEALIKEFEAITKRKKVEIEAAQAGVKINNVNADTEGKRIDNLKKITGVD